jgi:hypothetical protein
MRTPVARRCRSLTQCHESPGIVTGSRFRVVALALAVTLSVCGTAAAKPFGQFQSSTANEPAAPVTERTYSDAGTSRSAPLAERTYSESPSVAPDPPSDAGQLDAAAAAVVPEASSSGGLGALAIVLISVGGVVVLAGLGFTARRVVHQAHPAG